MYHFISGYTAKVAGTEMGVTEPQATFSPCFGGPFLVWHPSKYAELLAEKMRKHKARVWLVNTGWGGGGLRHWQTHQPQEHARHHRCHPQWRAGESKSGTDPMFGFDVVTEVPRVPAKFCVRAKAGRQGGLRPAAKKLAGLFNKNFETYAAGASAEVKAAAPKA